MTDARTTTLGRIEVRNVDGAPGKFEGMAIPYNVTIDVAYGRERFVRGAFAEAVDIINSGERVAYLNKHGVDGGVAVGAINKLQERSDGLWFFGDYMNVPEKEHAVTQVLAGINGVSVEFVPGKHRRKGDVIEHYAGVRLAAVAGSYAPAYRQARVALRSVARATERIAKVPNLTVAALTERRDTITSQIAAVRAIAESENRALEDDETRDVDALTSRLTNVDALLTDARADEQRRDAERKALPAVAARGSGSSAVVTRAESVYGPHTQASYFADLMTANRDSAAGERLSRHKALIVDLAQQMNRAVDSSDLAGAYPVQNYPDLYVPDIAYSGPLSAFFAVTPITAPNPISLPTFGGVTGDTDVQTAENAALPNVDVATVPKALTPKTIGGETIVSRQAVDGASPGTDVIISNQLRELLMRDTEREIALVLEALPTSGAIPDTAGVTPAASGRDLHKGIASVLGQYYAGAAAGGAGARMLPAEGVFVNSKDWGNLAAGEDASGRPVLAYINPVNALGQLTAPGFQRGVIGGVVVEPAWALLAPTNEVVARRNDARQWKSAILDIRLVEREGPQSIVFAIWQYFAFAVLEPKGVRRYTYTNV